jgi:hypothetical protein
LHGRKIRRVAPPEAVNAGSWMILSQGGATRAAGPAGWDHGTSDAGVCGKEDGMMEVTLVVAGLLLLIAAGANRRLAPVPVRIPRRKR